MNLKSQGAVVDAPVIGQFLAKFPFAAAGLTAVVKAVPIFPASLFTRARPDNLRIGPHQSIRTPLLVFHPLATIK